MFDSDGDNDGHPELPYDGVVGLGKFLDYAAVTHISPYLLWKLSDRHGRTFVSGFCTVPVTDLSFILVTQFPALIPGGYRFLFFGCALQGSLGGE